MSNLIRPTPRRQPREIEPPPHRDLKQNVKHRPQAPKAKAARAPQLLNHKLKRHSNTALHHTTQSTHRTSSETPPRRRKHARSVKRPSHRITPESHRNLKPRAPHPTPLIESSPETTFHKIANRNTTSKAKTRPSTSSHRHQPREIETRAPLHDSESPLKRDRTPSDPDPLNHNWNANRDKSAPSTTFHRIGGRNAANRIGTSLKPLTNSETPTEPKRLHTSPEPPSNTPATPTH